VAKLRGARVRHTWGGMSGAAISPFYFVLPVPRGALRRLVLPAFRVPIPCARR
jgi:hypothetical protein